jgi:hypothetical protein
MAITAGLGGVEFKSMVMGEAVMEGTSPPVHKSLVMSPSTVGDGSSSPPVCFLNLR